jgi:maltooligosyltrehalose trehalohydrolase
MGEEYGEENPFQYFVNHSDPELVKAVREGRKMEFTSFAWEDEPPDPEGEETFTGSKLNWERRLLGKHKVLLDFYRTLMALRKDTPALSNCDKDRLNAEAFEEERIIFLRRWHDKGNSHIFCIFNFNTINTRIFIGNLLPAGRWRKVLDSSDTIWNGPGALLPEELSMFEAVHIRKHCFALYRKESDNG